MQASLFSRVLETLPGDYGLRTAGGASSLKPWMRSKWQPDPYRRTGAEQAHDGTRFYVCLVLCANHSVCPEEILRDARLLMKKLNPRLHALYMARREGRDA